MSTAMDSALNFDLWETLDDVSLELTQTSEFWNQIHYEADRLDFYPPPDIQNIMQEGDTDWRILDIAEDHKDNIVHHDCMWAGLCKDSVHPNKFVRADYDVGCSEPIPGQSLLRRDFSPPRPETPPSLDDEEPEEPPQFRHAVDMASTARRLLRDSAAVAADHSYTAKQNFDNLGVQTPSDSCESEEEIDVVSLGTSQQLLPTLAHVRNDSLPRAPSVQERHHIQRTVASAMTPRPVARKRLVPPPNITTSATTRRRRGPGRRGRRSNTDTDSEVESPEIERRSIHNDMERLRRIGLKNLFDELKKQIPATKDKERAPKVVILREAASLCRRLREEDSERDKLKRQQAKLMAKLKKLRTAAAARYRPY